MSKINKYSQVSNLFYLPSIPMQSMGKMNKLNSSIMHPEHGGSTNPDRNLNMSLAPVPKPRIVLDVALWRESLRLVEDPILPQRYLMQICYMDTVLDAHLRACLERRENLTLLRKFKVCDESSKINDEWTKYFSKTWFKTFTKYAIGAKWFGYTLISMGNIVNGEFKDIVMIPRTHISPDRLCVVPVPNAPLGPEFMEPPYNTSHIWVSTPDEHGLAACGYGMLYELTLLAIGLRNNLQFNQQFMEVFGMPYRYIKTDKQDKKSQDNFEASLALMGTLGYSVIGKDDELVFQDTAKGQGFKVYSDLEMRIEKKISKVLLGHSDALDPTAGKLGSGQGDMSPQSQALNDIQSSDGEFMMEQINGKLLPFMRANGINIPENLHFEYCNDTEDKEVEKYRNDQNLIISEVVMNMANGGLTVIPTSKLQEQMGLQLMVKPDPTIQTKSPSNKIPTNTIVNAGKKPAQISQEEWDAYKLDLEYKKQTKGFDGDRYGLTKEEYNEYADDIDEHIKNDIPLEREDGDAGDIHIGCNCVIEGGVWITTGENTCDECYDAQEDYNTAQPENKIDIYNSHKDLIMSKKGLMSRNKHN